MTIQAPSRNISDKILSAFGKRRAVFIPGEMLTEKYGIYKCRKESFLRALLRPKDAKPPEGWVYW
ncbi:MAG: hypothetical protein WC637_10485 [Victivallales bacterium]|jgi:hypothetical protein